MLRFGRYGITFGKYVWFQTRGPTIIRHFLWFWFIKEVKEIRPWDVDEKQQFPIDTLMEYEGRVFRYWKADRDIGKGEVVWHPGEKHQEGGNRDGCKC